ncbi:phospho-acceptor domain-containing protein [Sphingomonas aerolata]|uniref:histidine kinase n=1 Tax=Sphingomonas aerolata TaxID=185951 RepID=A0A2T4YU81_9SPHN|nr:ATP-binding protein [Sphingomonas aerolata]PTM47301.1 phospho-acceptor domain-containing protein [Sphingomonas aerolata]
MNDIVNRLRHGGEFQLAAEPLRQMTVQGWALTIVLLAVAIGASSFRIILAPGFEMYLGPLFYLLAYRLGGLRLAIPMVLLTMASSWFWWGHIFTIALALGHVVFINWTRFAGSSLAIATAVFLLTIGTAAGFLFLRINYDASLTIFALTMIRKLLNDVLMAALVDLALSLFVVNLPAGRVSLRRTISLAQLLPASITLIVLACALVMFVSSVRRFPEEFKSFMAETALLAEVRIGRGLVTGNGFLGVAETHNTGRHPQRLLISDDESSLRSAQAMQLFGCTRIDDGLQVTGPNDRNTFAYWVTACQLGRYTLPDRKYFYLYSTRPAAESAYRVVLLEMLGLGVILVVSILLQLLITRALRRSLQAWKEVAEGFGQPGLSLPQKLTFNEFDRPIAAIVTANNSFAELVQERLRIARAFIELKKEMDLSLAADIRFDAAKGTLAFLDMNIERVAQERSEAIHTNDCLAFADICDDAEAFVEFRLADQESSDWYLFVGRDLLAPGHWRSGWLVRLRQSKLAQNRMLQQARLVELGGMASALSHELKQPLFTISLSAENGRLLLDQASPDGAARARDKFDRISEQVNRARDIIARISRYARIENDSPEPLDLGDVVSTTLSFMRPLLIQHDVGVKMTLPDGPPVLLLAPRVGLEQVLVNAIQNAVDSIATRREAEDAALTGAVELEVTISESGVRISIVDNGAGLSLSHPDRAFDAFMTTKETDRGTGLGLYISRQIVMEIGGKISIRSREAPEQGAILTIDFPDFVAI